MAVESATWFRGGWSLTKEGILHATSRDHSPALMTGEEEAVRAGTTGVSLVVLVFRHDGVIVAVLR